METMRVGLGLNRDEQQMWLVKEDFSYRSTSGYRIEREYGTTPCGNALLGSWVLRDPDGSWVDCDRYRYDLMSRHLFVSNTAEWRPIQAAPPGLSLWVVGVAQLVELEGWAPWQGEARLSDKDGCWHATSYCSAGQLLIVKPTHWRPLPELPQPPCLAGVNVRAFQVQPTEGSSEGPGEGPA